MAEPNTNPNAEPAQASKGPREKVVIGCKLPNGLLLEMRDRSGTVHRVKLAGAAAPIMPTQLRPLPQHLIQGGYGLTSVDKEMWDAWVAEHPDFTPLKRGFVFATKSSSDTAKEAQSRATEKSGLEPIPQPKKTDKPQVIGPRNSED